MAWYGGDAGEWVCRVAFDAEAPPLDAQKGNVSTHEAFEAKAPPLEAHKRNVLRHGAFEDEAPHLRLKRPNDRAKDTPRVQISIP